MTNQENTVEKPPIYPPQSPCGHIELWHKGGFMARIYDHNGDPQWRQWFSSGVSAADEMRRRLCALEPAYRKAIEEWQAARARLSEQEFKESRNG